MASESVQQITGDTPMRHREQLLSKATVALVTPEVGHAWLVRTVRGPAQTMFLANLRIAVTGEAHVYEDVLGYNAACMFRCLDEAIIEAGNRHFIRHIAATATIRSPEKHMQDLSGRAFRKVDLETMVPRDTRQRPWQTNSSPVTAGRGRRRYGPESVQQITGDSPIRHR